MKDICLEIKDLNKKFGQKEVVKNINLNVNCGEIYCLIGPNGAGKTTTIKMITGLLLADKGEIKICNDNTDESRNKMAYIPDEPFVYQYLTGMEFLKYVGNIYGLSKKEIKSRTLKYVEELEIKNEMEEYFETYSRGTKQKLMIIAAFMRHTQLLIIDEPIVGLDVNSQNTVKKMFREYANNGGAILLCTHTLNIAEEIADKIGVIKEGKLIKEFEKDLNNLEDKYLKIINE